MIAAFLGIPYAAPPLGERRRKAPVLAALWTGTFDVAFTFNLGPWPRYEPDSRACLVVEPTQRIALDPDGPELRTVYGVG